MSLLICVALQDELPNRRLPNERILYTGVGKVNAAMTLAEALATQPPSHVINFGTAGALRSDLTGLVQVAQLHQRDMDVRGLGVPLGQTPFEQEGPIVIAQSGVSCGTGDSFVQTTPELVTDIVDMEAYALAKTCERAQIPFTCVKYISDNANDAAHTDWRDNMTKGADAFCTWFEAWRSTEFATKQPPMTKIRRFQEEDRAQTIALWQRCGLLRPWNDPDMDITRKLSCQAEGFLILEHEGAVIGSAMFGYDGHRGMVYYLAIDPLHQGRGHARALMMRIEELAISWGCPKINLFVRSDNDQATGLYKNLRYAVETSAAFGKRLIPDD